MDRKIASTDANIASTTKDASNGFSPINPVKIDTSTAKEISMGRISYKNRKPDRNPAFYI